MSQLRLAPTFAASAALLFVAFAPRAARALGEDCSTNADCAKGSECAVVGSGSCPGAAPCAPGSSCPEPEPCVVTEEKACVPAQCSADAQCADGMLCHAWPAPCAATDCACSSDVPDCKCGPSVDCEASVESYCTPKYLLPCQTAVDCGAGFDCVEEVITSCTGGGSAGAPTPTPAPQPEPGDAPLPGSAGSSSDEAPPADPLPSPECTSQPSGTFYCAPKQIECDATSDCPSGWLCVQEAPEALPGCAGEGCPEPAPLPPARRSCEPALGLDLGFGHDDGGVVTSPSTPTSGNPGSGNSGTPEKASDADASNQSTACQMGHAPATQGALSLLAMLGALIGLKRRRS